MTAIQAGLACRASNHLEHIQIIMSVHLRPLRVKTYLETCGLLENNLGLISLTIELYGRWNKSAKVSSCNNIHGKQSDTIVYSRIYGTHVSRNVLLLTENGLISVKFHVERGHWLCNTSLVGHKPTESVTKREVSSFGMYKSIRRETYAFLDTFSTMSPYAEGSKLACSTDAACSNKEFILRLIGRKQVL